MRDEVKQYKEECKIVMYKLARIAEIIVNLCEKYNLSEEDLPVSLRAILASLQRELDRIEYVLKKCSKRKGFKGLLQRKDLLTKIKQCDVELSNVLQAFQAELLLDVRVALIVMRPMAAVSESGPIEPLQNSNDKHIFGGIMSMKGSFRALRPTWSGKDQSDLIKRPTSMLYTITPLFFLKTLIPDSALRVLFQVG
jgi:hypothetical protein